MPDSKTNVYPSEELRLHGKREIISIRVKPELKEALLKFCQANGLSICHVFEMLTSGYLTGMKQKIDWVNQSPTIELTVVREVKRVRRYAQEHTDMVTDEMEMVRPRCAECPGDAVVRLRKEGKGWVYSCSSHREMFMKRGFVQELIV